MISVGVYIVRSSRPVSTSSRRIAAEQPLLFALRDAVDSGRKLPRDTNAEDLGVPDSGRAYAIEPPCFEAPHCRVAHFIGRLTNETARESLSR